MLDKVKHVILVLSGKGGVGKSTVSTQLALALAEQNQTVGILDTDLCGPSVPYLLGIEDKRIYQTENGWLPIKVEEDGRLCVMSISFLLKSRNDPVIWRGPKKTSMIKTFIEDIAWDDLDYLIVDTPPGTSDEHITVMECMRQVVNCDGALIVTTPQQVALDDVRKEITFCKKTGIPILGIVENMSGFICPHCQHCTNIFSSNGGHELAKHAGVPHLVTLPIDPRINQLIGTNRSVIIELPDSTIAQTYKELCAKITLASKNTI